MNRPNIIIERQYDATDTSKLNFIDQSTKKVIGYINYKVWDIPVILEDGNEIMEDQGRISDMVLDEDYQKMGILTDIIDRVLCDLKCKGAEKRVTLSSQCPPKVWEKFGFRKTDEESSHMERDITNLKCVCVKSALGVQGVI